MSGVTVIGLVQGGCLLEDIRTTVPHRMAIQIPAPLAERSQDLVEALQQRRVMRLGAGTVVKESPAQLNTSLRGRGIAPVTVQAKIDAPAPSMTLLEREVLVLELEASREQCRYMQSVNEALQATLQRLTSQLAQIQGTLDTLVRRPGPARPIDARPATFEDAPVPHYIPDTNLAAAEVRLNLSETTSTSNLDDARAALRSLRGKPA